MQTRYLILLLVVVTTAFAAAAAFAWPSVWTLAALLLAGAGALRGIWDLMQPKHSLARNYPLIWALRYGFEAIRPQIRQYLIESDTEGTPFDREQRSLVYQRAKNANDLMPFGTERDVTALGFEWINQSIQPADRADAETRVLIGGEQCSQPYSSALLNISAMSFGSLSAQAIRALNAGARRGGFAHDTGEGGLSPYHLEHGGDLIWEIGSGYFGCRTRDGRFDPARFAATAAHSQVRMLELKLSQGAKPGHGGVLPGDKVTPEIAATRGVDAGVDCVSPARHSAFATPAELMKFIGEMRELSQGKPVGFKLCIGHRWEFLALCKAMLETQIYPDFIVIDGKEGGTGAAPVEYSDHVGTPRREGLVFAVNALVGCGIRDRVRIGVSGKIISGFDMAVAFSLGADWCNSARGFMFALGCLQSQKCHTNRCPVGIATQDPLRQRAIVVPDKAQRVASFHRHTVNAFIDIMASAGIKRPEELAPSHIVRRVSNTRTESLERAYEWLEPGQLLQAEASAEWIEEWRRASPHSFSPVEL